MKTINYDLLCCPCCKGPLINPDQNNSSDTYTGYLCNNCNNKYIEYENYVDFLGDKGIIHNSRREKIVRTVYARFYTPMTNFMFLFCGGVKNARKEVIDQLEIKDNDHILETGMGPGDNFPLIRSKAENLKITGIDIQVQMMIHCTNNLQKWNDTALLFRADAEQLPFRDEAFDVVFHLGAFNMFSNKQNAVNEMIRVAKHGTRIVIADESEKGNRIFNRINGTRVEFISPDTFVPGKMNNINLKTIWKGFGFLLAFTKP